MEVTFQVEREDYWQYNKFVIGRVPALKRQTLIGPLIISVILVFDLWAFHLGNLTWLAIFGVVMFGFWLAFTSWTRKRVFLKTVEAKPGALGLHTLALRQDGLHEQSAVMETIVKWEKVTEIAESPHLIVLFLSPRYGFLVPKRAFPITEGALAFLERARAYHKSALDGTAPILPELSHSWPPAPQRLS